MVRLLDESAASGRAAASVGVSTSEARPRSTQPPPAATADPPNQAEPRRDPTGTVPAMGAEPDERPPPRPRRPRETAFQGEDPAEVANALESPPPPLTPPDAAPVSSPPQSLVGMPSRPSGPEGAQLARGDLGRGGGNGAARLDRVARPAVPIRPHYPPRARQRGEEADVAVHVWVGAEGTVDQVAVSKSAGAEFDAAAVAAVEKARFHPALRDGEQVPSRVALRLHFRLER
jgi:protein TonB